MTYHIELLFTRDEAIKLVKAHGWRYITNKGWERGTGVTRPLVEALQISADEILKDKIQ